MSELGDFLDEALSAAVRRMEGDILVPGAEPRLIPVSKIGVNMYASTEMLLAAGAITEEQAREMGWTPPPPIPRLRCWRWRVRSWWYDHRPTVHLGACNHEDCA